MLMPSIFGENLFDDDWFDFDRDFWGRKNPLLFLERTYLMMTGLILTGISGEERIRCTERMRRTS